MGQLTYGELISLGSLAVAAIALVTSFMKGRQGDAARDQKVDDKLDHISESLADMKQTLRGLAATQNDVLRLEEQMRSVLQRLDRIEKGCDVHLGIGGTE